MKVIQGRRLFSDRALYEDLEELDLLSPNTVREHGGRSGRRGEGYMSTKTPLEAGADDTLVSAYTAGSSSADSPKRSLSRASGATKKQQLSAAVQQEVP